MTRIYLDEIQCDQSPETSGAEDELRKQTKKFLNASKPLNFKEVAGSFLIDKPI